eukprot:4286769-Alexandrium_andersonii.AAC.1
MALYGCEATAWPKATGRQVGAEALSVLLGARATMRAPELAWAAIEGIEPQPWWYYCGESRQSKDGLRRTTPICP